MIQANDENLPELLKQESKVMLMFYTKGCGVCKMIKHRLSSQDDELQTRFVAVEVESSPKAAQAFGVRQVPYFVTMHEQEVQETLATSFITNINKMLESLENIYYRQQA